MYLSFEHPIYLFFLALIPLAAFLHFFFLTTRKKNALKFANFDAISRIRGVEIFSNDLNILIITCLIIFFCVMALSGVTLNRMAQTSDFSFVIAIDSSKSMSSKDVSPDRIGAAKQVALEFVKKLPSSVPVAVISFSGNSYIYSDLNKNREEIYDAIKRIEIGKIDGTDVTEAVITSVNLLKNSNSRAIILVSDGQINVGDPEDAIFYARENNVVVHTLLVGSLGGADENFVYTEPDETFLKAISYNTNGKFYLAKNFEELNNSFGEILDLKEGLISQDLTYLSMFFVLFFIILEFILISSRRNSIF